MNNETLAFLVPVAVALASGSLAPKLVDVIREARKARKPALTPEQRAERAERRMRIAIEWGHRNAVLAIKAGVPEKDMPKLEFGPD